MSRRALLAGAGGQLVSGCGRRTSAGAGNEARPAGALGANVEVLGYCPMDDRPAFKMAIREVAGRWWLYTGHFWQPGWSVVDVTDPAAPRVARFLPGPPNTWTLQVDLHGDLMITALEKVFPNFGGDPAAAFEEGMYLWDIRDPVNPVRRGHFRTGGTGTHRNLYPGGRYAHLAAGVAGYRGNIYLIVDVSDPRRPTEAGRWWVPGQHAAGGETFGGAPGGKSGGPPLGGFCFGDGEHVSLHGPPYVVGELAYLPYGAAGLVVLDVRDVARPTLVSQLSFSPPFHPQFGVHGVLPVPELGLAFANSEDVSYGRGPAHHASLLDLSDPRRPWLLSLLPEPVPAPELPYRDFNTRGGWCGPHNLNHHQHHPDVEKQGGLLYLAHFNAGLRIYDVSNRRLPREVGWFLPPDPARRFGPMPEGKLVTQTEDVVVDRRGVIYISDKNQGVWLLRYTGPRPAMAR